MEKVSFETRESRDSRRYIEINAELKVKEHTQIQMRVNLERLDGSASLAELQSMLLHTAIQELQRERARYPAQAKNQDQHLS